MQFRKKSAWACSIFLLAAINVRPLWGEVHHSDAHVRQSLAQIISADKYRYDDTNATSQTDGKTIFERILEKIDGWVTPVKKYVRGLFLATSAFAIAVYAVIGSAIITGIVLVIRKLKPAAKRIKSARNDGESGTLDYERQFLRSKYLAREGRFREAIQCCIKAIWLFYHYKGYMLYKKDTTNREYLALLDAQPEKGMLEEIVIAGEMAIYGEGDATREICDRIHQKAFEILSK